MNEVTLPPSSNWYLNGILACASDGTVAWGARFFIVIAKENEDTKKLEYKIIDKAHKDKVTSVAFSPLTEADDNLKLVSCGDDNILRVWSVNNLNLELEKSVLNTDQKCIAVDWSKYNSNLICCVSDDGTLVTWDIKHNITQRINLSKLAGNKVIPTCIACCPHDGYIVAVGSKSGLIFIIDIRVIDRTKYKFQKLRGHNKDIVSLSWCPVPTDIFQEKNTTEFYLASGAKDRDIYLWKARKDYRYEVKLTHANAPLDTSQHKTKVSASAGNFSAVCWLEPTTLLASSPWGELVMWDLAGFNSKKKFTSKLVHAIHAKGLFAIAGVAGKSAAQTNETLDNEDWRTKTNIKAIWTTAQDRQIVCSSVVDGEIKIEHSFPTMGGFVYCMSACPIDTSQIAVGLGDNTIRLWNLSEPHERTMDMQILWENILGKVRALSWHPDQENLLAYATNEGRVGVYDTNVKKPPILYRSYHRNIVYKIGWGPAPGLEGYALYSVADYELVYYTPGKTDEKPTSVVKDDVTEFEWKPDFSLLALGFKDGSVSFLKPDLTSAGEKICDLSKPIQCLTWHPECTSSDVDISPMQNYLAVATTGKTITIFEIFNEKDEEDNSLKLSHKIVATLDGHSEKVVSLAWSPHISGYLVSGSYDYSAQVWKVETQEVIASFTGHTAPVQCCMWSPLSQDLILTGAVDFTLRMWSISKQDITISQHVKKMSTKGKRTKKKKSKELVSNDNSLETNLPTVEKSGQYSSEEKISLLSLNQNGDNNKTAKKKKKRPTHFPKYAELIKDNDLWCSTVSDFLHSVENDSHNGELSNGNGTDHSQEEANTISKRNAFPMFLGNNKQLQDGLNQEKEALEISGNYNLATEIDMWQGNLKENLENASKKRRLTDSMVALAPSISREFWTDMCEAYALQLISEENYHKAVSYLLCLNQVHQAIDVFVNAYMFKEAYAIASSRFSSENPVITTILTSWANKAQKDGDYQNACVCYIKLKDYNKAAKVLERRKDFKSLVLATELAELSGDKVLMTSMAEKAVLEALLMSDVKSAKSIVSKYSVVQHREQEIEIFGKLDVALKKVTNNEIINWLCDSDKPYLIEDIKSLFTNNPIEYLLLVRKLIYPVLLSENMVQVSVSHQLALSTIADENETRLRHIVKALDFILQYDETDDVAVENQLPLLIKYFAVLESKHNLMQNYQNVWGESIRAYLCYAIMDWYLKAKLSENQKLQCTEALVQVFKACVGNLLNKESIEYWTTGNEIKTLELKLTNAMGKVQDVYENHESDTELIMKRMSRLKVKNWLFIQKRWSAPNPLLSYPVVLEFINSISSSDDKGDISKLVTKVWTEATACSSEFPIN